MRKIRLAILVTVMSAALCACGRETTGTMRITDPGTSQTVSQTDAEEADAKTDDAGADKESMTDRANEEDSANEDASDTAETTDPSWPDVAELVNLKGDETTVYLLADGRYMDRTSTVYLYDGADTWTDEAGVEWNESVHDALENSDASSGRNQSTSGSTESELVVNDPYDLYSWDEETNTYIPYQQADGTAEPIGRGNGWYYFDKESGNYLPW